MFEKDMTVGVLLDFYGDMLNEKALRIMEQYYCDDLSLSEIAESEGISRQGVRHAIKHAEESLRFYEEKLGLAAHFAEIRDAATTIRAACASLSRSNDETTRAAAEKISAASDFIISKI